jgi:outer membrane protein TolC
MKRKFVPFLMLLMAHSSLYSYTIKFDQAIKLAVENNKELKAKELTIKKAEQDLKEAKGYDFGKFEFKHTLSNTNNAGYVFGMKMASREASFADFGFDEFLTSPAMIKMMNNKTNITPAEMDSLLATEPEKLNDPKSRTNFESKFVYELPIYVGGMIDSAKKMASLQVMANEAKYQSDEKKLGLEVLKAYNGAVTAKKFIDLTQESRKVASRFIKTSDKLYKDGLTRIIDVKQARMAFKSIDAKLSEAKANYKLAIAYLQFLTNDKKIDDVEDFKNFDISSDILTQAQEDAIENRDDFKWMNFNLQTMKEKINMDSSSKYPTIGAHIEYGFNDDKITINSNRDYYLAAIGLEYTIFDGYRSSIAEQKAKIEYQKIKHYYDYMKDGISLEVKKYFIESQTSKKVLKEKEDIAVMADDILVEMESLYSNNLRFRTNMMYLLMQLGNMVQAKADVIMTSYNKSLSEANLKLAMGESLASKE